MRGCAHCDLKQAKFERCASRLAGISDSRKTSAHYQICCIPENGPELEAKETHSAYPTLVSRRLNSVHKVA